MTIPSWVPLGGSGGGAGGALGSCQIDMTDWPTLVSDGLVVNPSTIALSNERGDHGITVVPGFGIPNKTYGEGLYVVTGYFFLYNNANLIASDLHRIEFGDPAINDTAVFFGTSSPPGYFVFSCVGILQEDTPSDSTFFGGLQAFCSGGTNREYLVDDRSHLDVVRFATPA